jgi:diguanylate cyclase (GGDEF)-like protein
VRTPPRRLASILTLDPEERVLAGRLSGALYVMGGLTLWSFVLLPGVDHHHPGWIIGISAGALIGGLCSLGVIDWSRRGPWLIHLSNTTGFVVIASEVASSGGGSSPGWIYLFFIVVFASYFYRWMVGALYVAASVLIFALPLIYDPNWSHSAFLSRLVVGGFSFVALGVTIASGKELMRRVRSRAELLAAEQGALRRVATAVIEGHPPESVFELVAREAAALLRGGAAGILRFDSEEAATVMGSWADHEGGRYERATIIPIRPGSDVARAQETGLPVRIDSHRPGTPVHRLGYAASIVAPVRVGGHIWGAVAVAAAQPRRLTQRDEEQLMEFGELLASAIASIDERATLAAQASTDPLTGLANRRSLHERLAAEVARSQRHGGTLSVAVLDIDHFKQVNDFGGHEAGDQVLAQMALCLQDQARAEDVLGRFGGDEFAWVMPETTREEALVAIERARRLIATTASKDHRITVSAGICDTLVTSHPAELINHADSALYWSKVHGRDRAWIYDPRVSGQLTSAEPDRADRVQALMGLTALSRTFDGRDPATSGHSERVAALAARLAQIAGWSQQRTLMLRQAALVHDIGKVGLPERLLGARHVLTPVERELVAEHVELAVRLVEDVLAPEQVDWIRSHHERPDGLGYPRGLREEEISEGAALLAVADAWEAMRTGRPYRPAKSPDAALAECAALIGSQFTRTAVGALMQLHALGHLDDGGPRLVSGSPQPSAWPGSPEPSR